ncbi:MAG: hypothetical protein QFB87_05540 [Patescibacteria group bacterium]|nr:hypothetical protein [Patescibacteria group bacterium]
MNDITNKQLLNKLNTSLETMEIRIRSDMATKDNIDSLEKGIRKDMATKFDIDQFDKKIVQLDKKIDNIQTANVKHHLETRKEIGDINMQFRQYREGLAKAAEYPLVNTRGGKKRGSSANASSKVSRHTIEADMQLL